MGGNRRVKAREDNARVGAIYSDKGEGKETFCIEDIGRTDGQGYQGLRGGARVRAKGANNWCISDALSGVLDSPLSSSYFLAMRIRDRVIYSSHKPSKTIILHIIESCLKPDVAVEDMTYLTVDIDTLSLPSAVGGCCSMPTMAVFIAMLFSLPFGANVGARFIDFK
ncbi:uncharacterized protein F5147DRAFT_760630 [Suillus discolor]|uniref:Uncharacterized protein n=1 Tax=Suillus discolor TaxID=1912936 RepID=A0A9P7F8B3_9AGAM|nr:uncharacterized protein F5147DRAFT_760630 [Suillus discolor]KAG2109697.1 hypothetical protein F5147DRAFT_760630 [Suillus discolor]